MAPINRFEHIGNMIGYVYVYLPQGLSKIDSQARMATYYHRHPYQESFGVWPANFGNNNRASETCRSPGHICICFPFQDDLCSLGNAGGGGGDESKENVAPPITMAGILRQFVALNGIHSTAGPKAEGSRQHRLRRDDGLPDRSTVKGAVGSTASTTTTIKSRTYTSQIGYQSSGGGPGGGGGRIL